MAVRVQRLIMPVTEAESWTLVDDDGVPVPEIESYLAYLTGLERSPNTVRAYALSLKLWVEFLAHADRMSLGKVSAIMESCSNRCGH